MGGCGDEEVRALPLLSLQPCALRVVTADSAGTVNAEVGNVGEGEHARIALAVDQKMDLTVVRRFHRSAKAPRRGFDQESTTLCDRWSENAPIRVRVRLSMTARRAVRSVLAM